MSPLNTLARLVSFAVLLTGAVQGQPTQPGSFSSVADSIRHFEGHSLTPYRDGNAVCVSYGHSLTAHHQELRSYTTAEVEAFLIADIEEATRACQRGVDQFDDLPPAAQMIAIHVAFTCGATGFHRFTRFRTALNLRAYRSAAQALRAARWYRQVGRRGEWAVNTLLSQP